MRRRSLLLVAVLLLPPSSVLAQAEPEGGDAVEPTVLGGVVGYNQSQGLWTPDSESESVGGVMLGGFVNAKTPLPWFSIRAELMWVQRGNDVTGVPCVRRDRTRPRPRGRGPDDRSADQQPPRQHALLGCPG
jgi:hypothetical protein